MNDIFVKKTQFMYLILVLHKIMYNKYYLFLSMLTLSNVNVSTVKYIYMNVVEIDTLF